MSQLFRAHAQHCSTIEIDRGLTDRKSMAYYFAAARVNYIT